MSLNARRKTIANLWLTIDEANERHYLLPLHSSYALGEFLYNRILEKKNNTSASHLKKRARL
jgi:hypothetical protein